MAFYDENGLRLGQRIALRTTLRRFADQCSHTALVIATRYGKSDLQRIIAMVAIELRLACAAVSLTVTDYLCDQMDNDAKWKAMCERTKLQRSPIHARIATCVINPTANGEHFLTTTIQFFQFNLQYWIKWAKMKRRQSGLPVILFVDECQTSSTVNKWGTSVTEWQRETDGFVVLLTATAERADGERIPGFEYNEKHVEDVTVNKTRPGSKPEKIRVDVYDGKKIILEIVAHATVDFEQAWREEVLCHIERLPIDVDLNVILASDTTQGKLSGLTNQQEIRRALSRAVRHPMVIERSIAQGLASLTFYRAVDLMGAMIVFCGNDVDTDASFNQHAKQIKNEILHQDHSITVIIATSKSDGKVELESFGNGNGTVIIVKQMAALGIDISRMKVGVDLSPVRTKSALIQRMMRVATPHPVPGLTKPILMCSWVTPADLLATAIYESVVTPIGQATLMDLELLRSYEKDREEPPEKPEYQPTNAYGVGANDTRGNKATESELDLYARDILSLAPEIGAIISQAELVRRQKEQRQQQASQAAAQPQSTKHNIKKLQDQIKADAKSIINARMASLPYTNYGRVSKEVWDAAYSASGVYSVSDESIELQKINDLGLLTRLREAFQQMLAQR